MISLRTLSPARAELIPWTDRKGRFNLLRATTFGLLLVPGGWLASRALGHDLGPEPVNAAIHSSGYYTIWLLLASLAVTPAKVLSAVPNVVVVRRMIGNAALCYAMLHLTLYAADQKWAVSTIVAEIIKRSYLTIGFIALAGLAILGFTSTDGWIWALGKAWKRLHRIVYGVVVLGLIHYLLQSKLDVSQAQLAAGVFTWLMLWRLLPAGRDRSWAPLLVISLVSALLTLGYEYAWYRFGTRVDPVKIVLSEFNIGYGLHPAGQVLALGLVATAGRELRSVALGPFGDWPFCTVLTYALGAFVAEGLAFFLSWSLDDAAPDMLAPVMMVVVWGVIFGVLGVVRWRFRNSWYRRLFDSVWISCVVYQVTVLGTGDRNIGPAFAALIAGLSLLAGYRVWMSSPRAAMAMVPFGLLLAYGVATLL